MSARPRAMERSAADQIERAISALRSIPCPADRETWWRVIGSALAEGVDKAELMRWCESGPNFSRSDAQTTINSLAARKGTGRTGSLFKVAREYGWRDEPARASPVARSAVRAVAESPKPTAAERPTFDVAGVWAACAPATAEHDYVKQKLGLPFGLRTVPDDSSLTVAGRSVAGWLAVPMNEDGSAVPQSLQFISPAGKKLSAWGRMVGWHTVGGRIHDGDTVFVCEGIGAAWSCHQAAQALAVVTFGVGRTETVVRSLRERFPAARLVIVPDVGQEPKARAVAQAVRCEWVELPADLGANGDANDLHQQAGMDALAQVLAATHKAEMPADDRFRILSSEEVLAAPRAKPAVYGVFPCEGVASMFGPSGSGKSFLQIDVAAAMAEGSYWHGHRVPEPLRVLILALEGQAGLRNRIAAWEKHHERAFPAAVRFITESFSLADREDVAALAGQIGGRFDVLFIDTLNRASPGLDENSGADMSQIIQSAEVLRSAIEGLVVLVHHTGKDQTRGLRGHSSLLAALDSALEVKRSSDQRSWSVAKNKDGQDGVEHSFDLKVIDLGQDEFGEPVTSCVVTTSAAHAPKRPAAPRGSQQILVLKSLGDLLRKTTHFGKAGAPPGRPCVELDSVIDELGSKLPVEAKRTRETVRRVVTNLAASKHIEIKDGWIWDP
jgi:putative DNA primase/helicase